MTKRKNSAGDWVTNVPSFVDSLPVLDFPFERLPDLFAPERTVLKLGEERRYHSYLWCFIRRKVVGRSGSSFDRSSLSAARVAALPAALDRLSKKFRYGGARPASSHSGVDRLGQFLAWADRAEHEGRYETVLSDPELALQALRGYHSFLRSRLQSHQVSAKTAAVSDQAAIAGLSTIHGCEFKDHIEALVARGGQGRGTKVPTDEELLAFVSRAQAVFDSAAELVLNGAASLLDDRRLLRLSAVDDSDTFTLPQSYTQGRLMELACLAFAALMVADSGANLAVLQGYEEPDDLLDQLAQPEKLGLRDSAIKFRAGGKLVPVLLTALTVTRLRTYLSVRQAFMASLGGEDIRPLFVQGSFPTAFVGASKRPMAIRPLSNDLLNHLRHRFSAVGADLPKVTLRQLRAYKQQHLVRHEPLNVAAGVMGHSVETALRAYCKAQKGLREAEMGQFFRSLEKLFLRPPEGFETYRQASLCLPGDAQTTASPRHRSRTRPCSRTAPRSRGVSSATTTGCTLMRQTCAS